MRLGLPVWPLQWNPPYEDAIRRIAAAGFQRVELIAWNRDALRDYYTPDRIRALRQLIADEGLQLSEFVSTAGGLSSADAAQRAEAVEYFQRLVEVALALGANTVNTVAPTPFGLRVPALLQRPTMQRVSCDVPAEYRNAAAWRENWAQFMDAMAQVCQICADAGVRYAVEPHPFRWVSDVGSMMRLLAAVPSPALGFNYDPSHTFPCGDLPHLAVYELGDRVFHCHLSDNDATHNAHWRVGKGKVDWRAFLIALHDVGFTGTLSIELEDVPGVAHKQPRGTASPEFERECVLSAKYLRRLAAQEGIVVE